jgi:hypothetical protein
MQTRPNIKNHDDLKVIITAFALTLTLAFWNIFSSGAPKPVQAAVNVEPIVPQTTPVKILLGGPPPKTTIIVSRSNGAQQQNQPRQNQQQFQQAAPQPVTRTASSK